MELKVYLVSKQRAHCTLADNVWNMSLLRIFTNFARPSFLSKGVKIINTLTEVCFCIYSGVFTCVVGCTSLINPQYYSKLCAKGYRVSGRVRCWHSNWLQSCTTSSRSKWKRSAIDQINPWGSDRETHWQSESFSAVTKRELQHKTLKNHFWICEEYLTRYEHNIFWIYENINTTRLNDTLQTFVLLSSNISGPHQGQQPPTEKQTTASLQVHRDLWIIWQRQNLKTGEEWTVRLRVWSAGKITCVAALFLNHDSSIAAASVTGLSPSVWFYSVKLYFGLI